MANDLTSYKGAVWKANTVYLLPRLQSARGEIVSTPQSVCSEFTAATQVVVCASKSGFTQGMRKARIRWFNLCLNSPGSRVGLS